MTLSFESLLPAAVNHLLKQEAWARAKLMPHAGKSARFEIGPTTTKFLVGADGLIGPVTANQLPAVTIRIRAADLPLVLQHRERAFSYVTIDGDADFANTISQLSQSLRWDIGGDLGKVVGDVAANRIVEGGTAVLVAARTSGQALAENTAEYFLEEQPMLVRPQAVSDFTSDVVRLRDDVERLTKRIGRLS
ncbi:MAG: sterol-binding protein [Pseudomonadota bacterium]